MIQRRSRRFVVLLLFFVSGFMHAQELQTPPIKDPFEPVNRFFWAFNYKLVDPLILKPIAHTYKAIIPRELRQGVSNMLNNINEPGYAINHFLTGSWQAGFWNIFRFGINTTVGFLGLFDVASGAKIDGQSQQFQQVLAHYHIGAGPYLMLPIVGAYTSRTLFGRFVDGLYFPYSEMSSRQEYTVLIANIVDSRTAFINQEKILKDSLDAYVTMRSIYWQRIHKKPSLTEYQLKETIPEEFLEEL